MERGSAERGHRASTREASDRVTELEREGGRPAAPPRRRLAVEVSGCASQEEARRIEAAALEIAREVRAGGRWKERLLADEAHALLWVDAAIMGMEHAVDEHGLEVPDAALQLAHDFASAVAGPLVEALGVAKLESLLDEYVFEILAGAIARAGTGAARVPVVAAREVADWYLSHQPGSKQAEHVARAHGILTSMPCDDAGGDRTRVRRRVVGAVPGGMTSVSAGGEAREAMRSLDPRATGGAGSGA